MSGWIKFEKELLTDPRVRRMAASLKRSCNAMPFHPITLVCGGLVRMWAYADSHIRDDDTLDMSAAELEEVIGIPGFCALLPECWFRELDERTVELPGFQEHNGVQAKKRALTAKRVQRHRAKKKRESVTEALPDQTRLDQTRTDHTQEAPVDAPSMRNTASRDFSAICDPDAFERVKAAYPKFANRQDWINAQLACNRLVMDGESWDDLVAAAERYARFIRATGREGTQYVLTPGKFFTAADEPWKQPWMPPTTKADRRLAGNIDAATEFLRRTEERH